MVCLYLTSRSLPKKDTPGLSLWRETPFNWQPKKWLSEHPVCYIICMLPHPRATDVKYDLQKTPKMAGAYGWVLKRGDPKNGAKHGGFPLVFLSNLRTTLQQSRRETCFALGLRQGLLRNRDCLFFCRTPGNTQVTNTRQGSGCRFCGSTRYQI